MPTWTPGLGKCALYARYSKREGVRAHRLGAEETEERGGWSCSSVRETQDVAPLPSEPLFGSVSAESAQRAGYVGTSRPRKVSSQERENDCML